MLADQNVRLTEAQQLIQRALDQEPNNGAYLDSLGWVYYQNEPAGRRRASNSSGRCSSFPKIPTIHDHLGDVYFKQGKIKDAITEWQLSLNEWNTSTPSDREPAPYRRCRRSWRMRAYVWRKKRVFGGRNSWWA